MEQNATWGSGNTLDEQLATHAHIHVHHGKTQVWNRGGVQPSGIEEMTRAARALKPEAVVWRGDPLLPVTQQGVKVLGIPIGKQECVQEFLAHKSRQQQVLFQRIAWVNDTNLRFSSCPCVAPQGQTSGCVQSDQKTQKTQKTLPDDMTRMSGPPRDLGHSTCVSGSACVVHLVVVSGRFGFGQCSSCSSRCTLGQLGRFLANGQTEEPSDRKVDDPTVGG